MRVTWPIRSGAMPPLADPFVTRLDTVPGIDAALTPGAAVALVPGQPGAAAAGLGWPTSSGKTQLAVSAAGSLWQSRTVDLLAWVTATSRASVLSGYVQAAARLGLDHGGDAESVAGRLLAWLSATARPWLFVLDDVRDAADLDGLWPDGPAGRVLLTTSNAEAVPVRSRALPVPVFSMREAMSYLHGRLTTDPDHRTGSLDLISDLGGEPAALSHATAVMIASGVGSREYAEYFAEQRQRLQAAAGGELPAATVTWMLSADYAEELLPGGGTWPLLVLAALLDGHAIPGTVLTAPAVCKYLAGDAAVAPPDPQSAWSAVQALARTGLVTTSADDDPPHVWIPAPLQAAARAAAPRELLDRAVEAAADALLEAWPKDQARAEVAARLRSCTVSLRRHAADALWAGESCHRVLFVAGQSLTSARLADPAIAWSRDLAASCDRRLGGGHPDTMAAVGQFADALLTAGQTAEAVNCSRWVLADRIRVLGPDHSGSIAAMVRLGRALTANGQADDAITALEEAVSRSELSCGTDDPFTLAALDEYAEACLASGNPVGAIRCLKRSLVARERMGPAEAASLASGLRLADAFLAAGEVKDAIGQYKRVLGDRERALGPDHPGTLAARASLAAAYDAAGQLGAALKEHKRVCAGYERTLGPDHPDTLSCQADLARACYTAGQLGDAVALLRDGIARGEQALSPGDPVTRKLRQVLDGITAEMSGE